MVETAIVVLHYKNKNDTFECLNSLEKSLNNNQYILKIVVSNSREDKQFIDKLTKTCKNLDYIENPQNLGFAQGCNVGIKHSIKVGCKNIILLNNDTIISSTSIDSLITFSNNNQNIGIVSPKIYFKAGYEYHKNRYKKEERGKIIWYAGGIIDWNNIYIKHKGIDDFDNGDFDSIVETDFATGCCMLIKKSLIDKVGYFNEKYFLYYEDVDFSLRAKKSGFKVYYYPKAHIWHKNASSSDKPGSDIHIYYQNRNRLHFGYTYASFNTKKSLFFDSLRLYRRGGEYQKAIIDYYFRKMGKRNT